MSILRAEAAIDGLGPQDVLYVVRIDTIHTVAPRVTQRMQYDVIVLCLRHSLSCEALERQDSSCRRGQWFSYTIIASDCPSTIRWYQTLIRFTVLNLTDDNLSRWCRRIPWATAPHSSVSETSHIP